MSARKFILVLVAATLSLGLAGAASGEEAPLADGTAWTASSEAEKEAYLVGFGNFMTVEYIVQQQADVPPTDEQSSIGRWWAALEDADVSDVVAAIDAYYSDNPDDLAKPVIMVLWHTYVEPK